MIENLLLGLGVAASPNNLLFCFIGALLGTLIGILPGLGPTATIAMLLPFTYGLDPVTGLIMLAGIYYGSQYGGSTTAILVNLPGEVSSVVTCIDGHKMALQGRAGAALTVAALGSLTAGCIATLIIAAWGPPLAAIAQKFSSPEYFALMVLGLAMAVVLARGSLLKGVGSILLGILVGCVGIDVTSGAYRYTFGQPVLFDGIGFAAVAMGVFGLVEIIVNLEQLHDGQPRIIPVGRLWFTKEDFRRAWGAVLRGTGVGSVLGILPGGGGALGAFASYALERRISRNRKEFGNGAIEGVAGPESANNAAAQTSFIPLLTLGVPSNGIMALLMGAMLIQGISPGPDVMNQRPDLFWGLIASMLIGNLMLVIINLPLIGIWVRFLRIPYELLFPSVLLVCCLGVYTLNNSTFEVLLTAAFAMVGYVMRKAGADGAPFLLGLVLGPQMEMHLRRAMLISEGDPTIFLSRPASAGLLVVAVLLFILAAMPASRAARDDAFAAEE
jgi:putative tricarboxylic transport membrane protein